MIPDCIVCLPLGRLSTVVTALFLVTIGRVAAANATPVVESNRPLAELRRALVQEKQFIKVHAAEALINLGYGPEVLPVFEQELAAHGNEPQYRVGIWRVLAQIAPERQNRDEYLSKLRALSLDKRADEQVVAIESLAKLRYQAPEKDRPRYLELAGILKGGGAAYCRWLLAVSGSPVAIRALAEGLNSNDADERGVTAYALRHLSKQLPSDVAQSLARAAEKASDSRQNVYVVSAALATSRDADRAAKFKQRLTSRTRSASGEEKYEICAALAVVGSDEDQPLLTELLSDPEADVRVSAANAIERIGRRKPLPFRVADWIVIAGYAALMVGIGVYYERRSVTTDDYLLGGRQMPPWAVGFSYFATLFSALSYLAIPGEMVQHGPLILASVLSYPIVFLVTTRFLIPHIMRLKVTSAYEILETRLGLSVRMLGASFFLILRLFWMSVIIFATSNAVLVPLLRLDSSFTPYISLALGALTVIYTSMGGLRAVVWTDVAQLFIMFFGAVISIAIISYALGGIDAWWPRTWDPNWEIPRVYDPSARVTLLSAMLSAGVWYVCTAGSDQMAIQRYLATRDASAARRMYGFSLVADATVYCFLSALGLALYAYCRANPAMLPDGQSVTSSGDQLFPQFIVKGLPTGVRGLVVAGILSAAMSSLASGLSATCSVITVDWIDRFRKAKLQDKDQLKLARRVSWIVGAVVIALSLFAGALPGNLIEICNKTINLLTAPLFVLFFMAMFVPWATTFGTWVAGLASTAVAVWISFFQLWGLSFLYITPVALLTGIVVGCLFSLLPIGKPRPMLEVDAAA